MTTNRLPSGASNGSGTALANAQQSHRQEANRQEAIDGLISVAQNDRLVGDLISMDYDTAEVLIHDEMKRLVGGIPHGCLLVATRMRPGVEPRLDDPDSGFILLRVLGSSKLPNDIEMQQKRLDAAKRASDSPVNYDEDNTTDTLTLHQMRYAGAHCRILGTFHPRINASTGMYEIAFGSDIDNFYAGQGMKIYKPAGAGLQRIVNFTKGENSDEPRIEIGRLRYSASGDDENSPESVPVQMTTADIIAKRSALFGMTRTGKSNTVKTIADAVFRMRLNDTPVRVSQLIIDPEGEYANENAQDQGAIRNLNNLAPSVDGDAVIHSFIERDDDPYRRIMKVNCYGGHIPPPTSGKSDYDQALASLYAGKEIINDRLQSETGGYVQAFVTTDITAPADVSDYDARTRYNRAVFLYRAILHAAGFEPPSSTVSAKGLFSKEIRKAMTQDNSMERFANILDKEDELPWDLATNFCRAFAAWKAERNSTYSTFNKTYERQKERNWHDDRIDGLLRIFKNSRGIQAIRECRPWHGAGQNQEDPIQRILDDLAAGRLVILDQALGNPEMNQKSAEQIMWRIFERQQHHFVNPTVDNDGNLQKPPPVIVYVEEAHTLLPRGNEKDNTAIWPRIAKEGAKFNIGLVYSTQEPSSVQTNILTNTENWFLSYLNSTDETRQLDKHNDFADFTPSIRKTNEPGFVRVRTHSNPYTLPVQIHRFNPPGQSPNGSGRPQNHLI